MIKWYFSDKAFWPGLPNHIVRYRLDGTRFHQATMSPRISPLSDQELADLDKTALDLASKYNDFVTKYGHKIYIRWNSLPKGGRSKNWATGAYEKGVSVYAATYNPATETIQMVENGTDAGAMLEYLIEGATPYLVTGDEVGTGSDGEPVLQNVRVLATLKPVEEGLVIA